MSAGAEWPVIEKDALFERLVLRRAGVAVVTPNKRLSLALAREFDSRQGGRGLSCWESADILPLPAFVERCYEDALYSDLAPALPVLLTSSQERALWEAIIRASDAGAPLLSLGGAAQLAAKAWQLAHEWGLASRLDEFP